MSVLTESNNPVLNNIFVFIHASRGKVKVTLHEYKEEEGWAKK